MALWSSKPLLCDRPPSRVVDYETSRFVVTTSRGLATSIGRLEFGDEIPHGTLSTEALRLEYEPPVRRIDLIEFAMRDPDLREACARRGVTLAPSIEGPDEVRIPIEDPSREADYVILPDEDDDRDSGLEDPNYDEECGTVATKTEPKALPDFNKLDNKKLKAFCREHDINDKGTNEQIRARLRTLLG